MSNFKLTQLLLRIALAFAFFYAAISSFLTPAGWIGYFPQFLRDILPSNLLLTGFSIVELIVALWLLSNKYVFYAAIIAALMLAGIVIFNFSILNVVFRDVSLTICALALASANFKKQSIK